MSLDFAVNPILTGGTGDIPDPQASPPYVYSGYDVDPSRPKRVVSAKPPRNTPPKNATSFAPPAHPPPVSLPSSFKSPRIQTGRKPVPSAPPPARPPPPVTVTQDAPLPTEEPQLQQEPPLVESSPELSPESPEILQSEPWQSVREEEQQQRLRTLPAHMRSLNLDGVPPSPVDEMQEWKPPVSARGGAPRAPPPRPQTARTKRPDSHANNSQIQAARTPRTAPPSRIKEGHWVKKSPGTSQRNISDGLDDTLSTVQLRGGLPVQDGRGSSGNKRMSKRRTSKAPPIRASRSRNASDSSTDSEFQLDQDFDGTGFQHVINRREKEEKNCIIA